MKQRILYACIAFMTAQVHAIDNIETIKYKVQNTLAKKNPKILGQYHEFSQQYDQLVLDFFDINNNEPLKTHVHNIRAAMHILKQTCDNPEFASVRPILLTYYKHGSALVHALKGYIGSHNMLSLIFKLRHFVFLLPQVVRNKGAFTLFRGLNHRLHCQ